MHYIVIQYPQQMVQMVFCDLSHTFHKQVTSVSQHVFVILLWGIVTSPLNSHTGREGGLLLRLQLILMQRGLKHRMNFQVYYLHIDFTMLNRDNYDDLGVTLKYNCRSPQCAAASCHWLLLEAKTIIYKID